MSLITWNDSYSVKVNEMDNQHKKLVDLINTMHDAMKVGKGKEIIGEISKALLDYTKRHFNAEEMLMKLHNYPGYEEQKRVHNQLVSEILDIQKKFEAGTVISQEVITFLKNWLVNHIQGMDQKYGSYLNIKGVH
jgi:hemerythrin-like metal-binding protein